MGSSSLPSAQGMYNVMLQAPALVLRATLGKLISLGEDLPRRYRLSQAKSKVKKIKSACRQVQRAMEAVCAVLEAPDENAHITCVHVCIQWRARPKPSSRS